MTQITGKTHAIIQRLPHFYAAEDAGDLFVKFVDFFGHSLEHGEIDALRVLRAHHVETADNVGSRGYTAPAEQRGDLDKIFGLYLEAIGGTTELVKMSPRFSTRSLDVRRLAVLLHPTPPPPPDSFVAALQRRLKPSVLDLLDRYAVNNAWFVSTEMKPGFAIALLRGSSTAPGARTDSQPTIAAYLHKRLSARTRQMLDAYTGAARLPARLASALSYDLNRNVLRDPGLYRKHAAEFEQHDLGTTIWALLRSLYRRLLRERYSAENDLAKRASLLAYLDETEPAPTPPGPDLVRLNRLLLERAFAYDEQARPWGFTPRHIPALDEVRTALIGELNRLLTGPELYRQVWFPELADDYPALRKRYHNAPEWLNRLVFEEAFPTAIEKSYKPYQERLRGLIQVLRRGASTRDGIVALVAANLGIVDDTPAARRQRQRIRIEEFAPERQSLSFPNAQPYSRFLPHNPRTAIRVTNPNLAEVTPDVQFVVHVTGGEHVQMLLVRWSLINRTTGQMLHYKGELHRDDRVTFSGDGEMRINGVPTEFSGGALRLPPGESLLEIEVLTGFRAARLDFAAYGLTLFGDDSMDTETDPDLEATAGVALGIFDQSVFDAVIFDRNPLDHLEPEQLDLLSLDVEVNLELLTPGYFQVTVPWDLGDFPADAADPAGHPRNQIQGIIDKVRAAGVFATVSYEQTFAEVHDLSEVAPTPILERPEQAGPAAAVAHDMADRLVLTGRMDYTCFDSFNGFDV
ncbi:hypothetical protein GC175_30845 [bacterium]|nr:hypothetical protein [bacterium]